MQRLEAPILSAYRTQDGTQLKVWCAFCKSWHFHGVVGPATGAGNGHRAAHCHQPDSPYGLIGYSLKEVPAGIERKHDRARRAALVAQFAVKFAEGAPEGSVSGYGAVFGNTDSYGDVIAKGAFKETLRDHKKAGTMPAMLMQHGGWGMGADDMTPVGIWTSMSEDDAGLLVEGRLALDTQRGKEAYALLKMQPRPALDGLSIGYVAKAWEIGTKPDEPRRTLKKIELWEVSLVTFPANPKARVDGVKAAGIRTIREFEDFLRDEGGFSRAAAKAIAAGGFKAKPESRDENGGLSELAELIKGSSAILQPPR